MIVFKYYIYVPLKNNYNINSIGYINEHTCFPTQKDILKFKLTPEHFLNSEELRKIYYEYLKEEVNETINDIYNKKFIWWNVNVFDEDSNFLFSYGKTYNKKLLS